jgi:alkylation response protein AidB-like acyl-CoA dehydrogenase
MFIEIEAARALAWKTARYTDTHDQTDGKLGYGTKVMCSEVATRCSSDAVQIFGGIGYTKDTEVEKLYRDARVTQIYEGTNDILRVAIAQYLEWGI